MSLVRIAARIAAIEALKGKTLVGDNVLDSEIGSLQVDADGNMRTDEDAPFITVYTDSASTKDHDISTRAFVVNGATEFLFEAGITAAMTETDPDTDETRLIGVGTPATDRALEFHLDMVCRQIGDALTDPDNEWAGILQAFISRSIDIGRSRTSGSDHGVRLAGHQIKWTVDMIPDPVRGQELRPGAAMAKFLAKAETLTDPDMLGHVAFIRAQIAGTPYAWQLDLRRYGMTRGEGDALLITMQPGTEADVAIEEIAVTNGNDS